MKRIQRVAAAMLCAVGFISVFASTTEAGTFTMRQCSGANQIDFQGAYGSINGSDVVDVVSGCTSAGSGKIGIYQDRSGHKLTFGDGGQFAWEPSPGTGVIGTQFSARLKDANGIQANLTGFNGTTNTDLDDGVAHDGNEWVSSWSNPANPQSFVSVHLGCASISKCANDPDSAKAFVEVTDVEFRVEDTVAPVANGSGTLWSWGSDGLYHRGSASVTIGAIDRGAGIAAAWAEVNGLRIDFAAPSCPGDKGGYSTRFTPCPLGYSATKTFNTAAAPFQEGANEVRLCVRDYAESEATGSKGCTAKRTVLVDNQISNPPTNLRSDQGSDWRPENGFTLRWGIPVGQVAPITGAVYVVKELGTDTQVDAGYFAGTNVQAGGPLEVPAVGAYQVTVYLVDEAANLGKAAETVIRFDDRPPGNVDPVAPSGWVSRDELPIQQEIEKAEPGGPSGVSGYAMTVSDDGPTQPCGTGICLAPEITLTGGPDQRTGSVGGLAEGDHWISAAAVSGAHRSSVEAGSTIVQVDRTPPSSSISGVPNEWVNHPVTLTVAASDRLSGMQPLAGDDGEPKTVIAADNHAPYEAPGPVATFAVATEGVNRIRYWAEDLAGNVNDGLPGAGGDVHQTPGQAVVRIDTTPPKVTFEASQDPENPEVVRLFAEDTDSGVDSASIEIRPAGSTGGFTALRTTGEDGRYEARVPSDDLRAGAYELRAKASDKAGNTMIGSETLAGDPMILKLPLKEPAILTSSLAKGKLIRRVGYGSRQYVEGRLTSGGAALPNQTVRITETYLAGSKGGHVVDELTTDGDGRYRFRLPAGPSRSVEATFAGTPKLSRAAGPSLRLNVKARVRLKIKPRKVYNGGAVRMRGSVGFKGALPPARGKLLAIQFFDPSRHKWRPVEVLRTNRRGRFHYTYRFRTISFAQRIIFRATALPEAGWPYLPSTSKPRSVIVYPKG